MRGAAFAEGAGAERAASGEFCGKQLQHQGGVEGGAKMTGRDEVARVAAVGSVSRGPLGLLSKERELSHQHTCLLGPLSL